MYLILILEMYVYMYSEEMLNIVVYQTTLIVTNVPVNSANL